MTTGDISASFGFPLLFATTVGTRGESRAAFKLAGLLAVVMLWGLLGTASAQEGGPYVGISGAMERLELFYEKTVDNTDPRNTSPSRGQVHRADDTAAGATYGVGFLAGYRLPLGAGGTYLSPEVDLSLHGGAVSGYLEGAGLSEGRNQLGESWPEDWSFEERRSYGLTVRLGAGISAPGTESELSVYALAGLRRLDARLGLDYAGCFTATLCAADGLTPVTESHDESFTGWAAGAGLEKKLGNTAIRGELRYTDYGSAKRVVPYDDLGISVPLVLEAGGASVLVSLIRHF